MRMLPEGIGDALNIQIVSRAGEIARIPSKYAPATGVNPKLVPDFITL